jgi:alanyl-tRNA synthetase
MKTMTHFQIREAFLSYFEKNGHRRVASSSLVPQGDDTLLFTNAGMNQFKNLFLGLESRDYKRAVSSQKCVRAGGKHNDLENVGLTARHHTFFEMLGNFSFGDYFKKEAIHFAWEFLTKELGITKDLLWVTVHTSDDEAANLWQTQEGVPLNRISRFGDDNFWKMGETGPCGPCSEIFFDHGSAAGCGKPDCKVGCSCDRFVEIWNLVFMQYFENPPGTLTPLPKPSVDTGSGLERLCSVIQGKPNNYDNDLFTYIIDTASELSGVPYKKAAETDTALRVLADHARATAFLIADGVIPANEGRGYVLRRIMRRGIRFGRKLSADKPLLSPLVARVIEGMGPIFGELLQNKNFILATVQNEEERFFQTLDQGTEILSAALSKLEAKNQKTVDGEILFKLYDTFGFPVDLTRLMAAERGFQVDEKSFEERMQKAREKSQASWKGGGIKADQAHMIQLVQGISPTKFLGYEKHEFTSSVLRISDGTKVVSELARGQTGLIILGESAFYAESGGQVGDTGTLKTKNAKLRVTDTQKQSDVFIHYVELLEGELKENDTVEGVINFSARRDTAANHSATHLLHAALKQVLGPHVGQAGSLVDPTRLRFDYTHSQPMSPEQIEKIENLVNQQIADANTILIKHSSHAEAIKDGAVAMFGEKYGDVVRVIRMGDFSTELCGGIHVGSTSDIRLFKLVSETGVSAGVRRIEGLTGRLALDFLMKNTRENQRARSTASMTVNWNNYLSDTPEVSLWMADRLSEIKNLGREIKKLRGSAIDTDVMIRNASGIAAGGRLVFERVDTDDRELLNQLSDKVRDQIQSGVVVMVGHGETFPLLVSVTKDRTGKTKAGDILKTVTGVMGGKGGGRPDFAQGAVETPDRLQEARDKVLQMLGV